MFGLNIVMLIGDILLIRGSAKHSKLIAKATRGPFSHACLVVGRTQIIEALTSSGVQYTSHERILFENMYNVAVLRPKFANGKQASETRASIIEIAKGHQSRGYNKVDAARSVFKTDNPLDQNKYFCSQLVASIYRNSGFPLFDKLDHNVTPNDFLKCEFLENVTSSTILPIPDYLKERYKKKGRQITFVDKGGNTTSDNALIIQEFLKKVEGAFLRHGLDAPNRIFDIINVLADPSYSCISKELDTEVSHIYDSVNLLECIKAKANNNSYDIEELKHEILEYGLPFVREEITWCLDTIRVKQDQYEEILFYKQFFEAIYESTGLSFASRQIDYYLYHLELVVIIIDLTKSRVELLERYLRENDSAI